MTEFLGTMLIASALTILRGIVLTRLWLWFAVPQFHVAPLGIPVALGITITAQMLTMAAPDRNFKSMDWPVMALWSLIHSLSALGLGWIYHLFM